MRTMNTEKLIKTLPIIQNQLDALLDFQVPADDWIYDQNIKRDETTDWTPSFRESVCVCQEKGGGWRGGFRH